MILYRYKMNEILFGVYVKVHRRILMHPLSDEITYLFFH